MFLLNKAHRKIVYFKAGVHLRSEASKTYLSIAWWIIEPVMMMAIYYFVFAVLLSRRTPDFAVFLLVGMVNWQWFATTVSSGMNSVESNRALISQLKFPKIVLPSVKIAMDTFKFAIVFLLLCVFVWVYGISPSRSYVALLPLLITQYVFISALANLAALAPPFLPDIKILITQVLRAGLFLSGVFYDFRTFDESYQVYFVYNPMALIMEMHRKIIIGGQYPDFGVLASIFAVSFVLLLISYWLFRRYDAALPRLLVER
jgi:lipopolysaccharide transport system permease protein